MRSAPVFGREEELALGDAFLDSAAERLSVLRLEGEAGIGKTTVWREVVRRAAERGHLVLSCRPAETETKLALSALADLLEPVPEAPFAALPPPQREALEIALLRARPGPEPLGPRPLATAVRSLLAGLAAERPLIVAVDDVQWLDAGSAPVLEYALRRLTDTPLGWLFGLRLPAPAGLAAEALVPPQSLRRVTLGPLDRGALRRMLEQRMTRPLGPSALGRVERAAGGNPLFALEIAYELRRSKSIGPGDRLPVPGGVRTLLAGRVPELPGEARDALLAAAALSHPTPELVERASSPAGLAAAEETGLVRVSDGRVSFDHPLHASVAYQSASRARRLELHERLARLVADREEQARHLALAATKPDESTARRLEQGAAVARNRGAWESAADLLDRARALTPPEGEDAARDRALAAAEHYAHAGDRARARALLERLVTDSLPPGRRAVALRLLGDISFNEEKPAEAERLFREALGCVDDPRLVVTIELGLSKVHAFAWDYREGVERAYRALEHAEATGDGALVAVTLAQCAIYDFLRGKGVDWDKVERALALEDPAHVGQLETRPSTVAGLLELYVGRFSEARARLRAVWTAAAERGDESDLAFVILWLAWLETRAGDFDAADELGDECASVARLTGSESTHAWVLAQQALVWAHRGAASETRAACSEAATHMERLGVGLPSIWIAAALGLLDLSLGDPRAAWRACAPLVSQVEAQGVGEPIVAFFIPEALEALIGVGEHDRAATLLDAFEESGRALDRAWALATAGRCRALLLASEGDVSGALAALDAALAEHARVEMPFELARTLLVAGRIQRRARRRARAKESFERALEIFDRVGAQRWAGQAREELEHTGLRRASGDGLTAREARVAELAARGLTNREVAAHLFVSPKTVEANLSRVYRKLGIGSRAELGARMGGPLQK